LHRKIESAGAQRGSLFPFAQLVISTTSLTGMPVTNIRACSTAVLLAATLLAVSVRAHNADVVQNGQRISESAGNTKLAFEEIARLFSAADDTRVVERVDRFVTVTATSLETVSALLMKAESQHRLGNAAAAAETYQGALVQAEAVTNNVTMRRFAPAYFRLAQILEEQRRLDVAITAVEAGLRLAPQSVDGQIFLGHLLTANGESNRALAHFRTQLASSLPNAEQRAVLGLKADRLAAGQPGASIQSPNLDSAVIYSGVSIGIVPVNNVPSNVALADVCVLLEASWRVHCEVLSPIVIPATAILDVGRKQYKADAMLTEIARRMPRASRRQSHLLAITDHDIFGPQTNFVFSWQQRNQEQAIGVLSTSRFASEIPDFYEPEIMLTRRVAIQALSTTGSMFGFQRPTDPECPLAYPESFREFQQKRLRLCASEEQQRDEFLRQRGGTTAPYGSALAAKIQELYRTYFVE
jgi:predicted Zn-dependent protease/predicted negative regulator of RcsB-dependent stress response